jgi:hypothetical protein
LILEEAGTVEDAVELYRSASDYEGVIRMTMTHAPAFVAEGRSRVIDEWIMSVPEEMRDNAPWLLYWLGVCRMLFNEEESGKYLEKAFNEFCLRKDAFGTYLSWACSIDTNFIGMKDSWKLDKWIEFLGVDLHWVLNHISTGSLKAEVIRQDSEGTSNYYIKEKNLRHFIISNPDVIDLRKVEKYYFIELVANGAVH